MKCKHVKAKSVCAICAPSSGFWGPGTQMTKFNRGQLPLVPTPLVQAHSSSALVKSVLQTRDTQVIFGWVNVKNVKICIILSLELRWVPNMGLLTGKTGKQEIMWMLLGNGACYFCGVDAHYFVLNLLIWVYSCTIFRPTLFCVCVIYIGLRLIFSMILPVIVLSWTNEQTSKLFRVGIKLGQN